MRIVFVLFVCIFHNTAGVEEGVTTFGSSISDYNSHGNVGTIYLAYAMPAAGVIYKVEAYFTSNSKVFIQLWHLTPPNMYSLTFQKEVNGKADKVNKIYLSVDDYNTDCPQVMKGSDLLAIWAPTSQSRLPIPYHYATGISSQPLFTNYNATSPPPLGTVKQFEAIYDIAFNIKGYIHSDAGGTARRYKRTPTASCPSHLVPQPTSPPCEGVRDERSGICYWKETTHTTWGAAQKSCQDKGGMLAMVKSPEINTLITDNMIWPSDSYVWIGGCTGLAQGVWRWTDTEVLSWQHWNRDQPNGPQNGYNQDCMVSVYKGSEWQDKPCWDSYPFVCQDFVTSPCTDDTRCSHGATWTTSSSVSCIIDHTLEEYTNIATAGECQDMCDARIDKYCKSYDYNTGKVCTLKTVGYSGLSCTQPGSMNVRRDLPVEDPKESCLWRPLIPANASTARTVCERNGFILTTAKSKAENDAVVSKLKGSPALIGLADCDVETLFKWSDGSFPTWTKWEQGYPLTVAEGEDLDCVKMLSDGTWRESRCSDSLPYVCKLVGVPGPNCDLAPVIVSASRTIYSDEGNVIFECPSGKKFSDGSQMKTVSCPCNSQAASYTAMEIGACEGSVDAATSDPISGSGSDGLDPMVIYIAVGVAAGVLLVITIIIVCCVLKLRKRSRRDKEAADSRQSIPGHGKGSHFDNVAYSGQYEKPGPRHPPTNPNYASIGPRRESAQYEDVQDQYDEIPDGYLQPTKGSENSKNQKTDIAHGTKLNTRTIPDQYLSNPEIPEPVPRNPNPPHEHKNAGTNNAGVYLELIPESEN